MTKKAAFMLVVAFLSVACLKKDPSTVGGRQTDRRLAVAACVDRSDPNRVEATREEISDKIKDASLPPLQAIPLFDDGHTVVWATRALTGREAGRLFDAAAMLKDRRSVVSTGELYSGPGARIVRIYSGLVNVSARGTAERSDVLAWARSQRLNVEPTDARRPSVLLQAPVARTRLDRLLERARRRGFVPTVAVHHEFGPKRHLDASSFGGYHRIPAGRRTLGMILQAQPAESFVQLLADQGLVVDVELGGERAEFHFVRFSNQQAMLQGLAILLAHPTTVKEVGPALSVNPPRFITSDLVVQFHSDTKLDEVAPILECHDLVYLRRVPYLEHGYMFRRVDSSGAPAPAYQIYEAARALLDAGHARLAVPDVIAENVPSSTGFSCAPTASQTYVIPLRVAEAWDIAEAHSHDSVIGVLDNGFAFFRRYPPTAPFPAQCTQLNVAAIIDTQSCPDDLGFHCDKRVPVCIPDAADDWCASCPPVLCPDELYASGQPLISWPPFSWPRQIQRDDHAFSMALIAAGEQESSTTSTQTCGVAPGARVIDAAQPSASSDWRLASTLWWMSGGDPGDCELGQVSPPWNCLFPHVAREHATVLNLSFSRTYAEMTCQHAVTCPPTCDQTATCNLHCNRSSTCSLDCDQTVACSFAEECKQSCSGMGADCVECEPGLPECDEACLPICLDDGAPCNIVDVALERLREGAGEPQDLIRSGGVMAVVAAPFGATPTDLPASGVTVTASTVATSDPYSRLTLYPPTDLVVPMGGNNSINFGTALDGGSTSGAAAAVSGVATLMFDVNPDMRADQAACILKQTARDLWTPPPGECAFVNGRSACFGHGMVDALGAVEGAQDCARCLLQSNRKQGEVIKKRAIEAPPSCFMAGWGNFRGLVQSPDCPCDEVGNKSPATGGFEEVRSPICLNCQGESLSGPDLSQKFDEIALLLWCLESGTCSCSLGKNCLSVEILNTSLRSFRSVKGKLCKGDDCREMFKVGAVTPLDRVRFPLPSGQRFLQFWGGPGRPKPQLILSDRTGEITLK